MHRWVHHVISLQCTTHVVNLFRYSRKILWLKVTPTNNNPKVILRFYLDTVGELEGGHSIIYSKIFIQ